MMLVVSDDVRQPGPDWTILTDTCHPITIWCCVCPCCSLHVQVCVVILEAPPTQFVLLPVSLFSSLRQLYLRFHFIF